VGTDEENLRGFLNELDRPKTPRTVWTWVGYFVLLILIVVTLPITLPLLAATAITFHLNPDWAILVAALVIVPIVVVRTIRGAFRFAVTARLAHGENANKFMFKFALTMLLGFGILLGGGFYLIDTYLAPMQKGQQKLQPTVDCPHPEYPLCHEPKPG